MTVHEASAATPDGTGVRDYVHVEDIAAAIHSALRHLCAGHEGGVWNIGTGRGTTTLQILEGAEQVTGRRIARTAAPPRAGDVPWLLADVTKARTELQWTARRSVVDAIESAYAWEQTLASTPHSSDQ